MNSVRIRSSFRTTLTSALCACLLAGAAQAAPFLSDGELTWAFDVTTTGNDIDWTSPTGVDPTAAIFNTSYTVTLVEVEGLLFGFPTGPVDITNDIDPALLSEADFVVGPAPVTLAAETVVFPDPPDPPAISGDITFGMNASGQGFFAATNVFLGTVSGITVLSIRIKGTLTAHATWFDLGAGLAGTGGVPVLEGAGTAKFGDPITLTLSNALPSSSSALIVGFSAVNAPFKGGTLVPAANIIFFGLPVDAGGQQVLAAPFPNGAPSRFSFYFQHWVSDGGAPQGFAASNGLSAETP